MGLYYDYNKLKTVEIPRTWWAVEKGRLIIAKEAPSWLKQEYNDYKNETRKLEKSSKDYIVDDRPRPLNPVILRMNNKDVEELKELLS